MILACPRCGHDDSYEFCTTVIHHIVGLFGRGEDEVAEFRQISAIAKTARRAACEGWPGRT